MKIYISADIEGVTGCSVWDETDKSKSDYYSFAEQMTREVNAACKGAISAGVKEIMVKDAHDSGRNLNHEKLPHITKLIRSWAGGLYSMVQELDSSFDALLYVGYHSPAGSNKNPLAHTMNTSYDRITINDKVASEFLIHSYIAAYHNVPVVFLSGDKGLCDEVIELNNKIRTVSVKEGKGNSTINIHPDLSLKLIEEGVKEALTDNLDNCLIQLPSEFNVEIRYKWHHHAYKASHYPSAKLEDEHTVSFHATDYIEVLRFFNFV